MKKLFLLVVILQCSVISISHAQIKLGLRAGLNTSTIVGGIKGPNQSFKFGAHVGPFARFKLSDKFIIQPEILFSMKGNSAKRSDTYMGTLKITNKLNYIDCPILFGYKPSEKWGILLGVQPSYLLNAKATATAKGSDDSTQSMLGLRRIDLGAVAGVQFETNFGLDFGLRICYGILSIDHWGVHNLNFMTTIGYAFGK